MYSMQEEEEEEAIICRPTVSSTSQVFSINWRRSSKTNMAIEIFTKGDL